MNFFGGQSVRVIVQKAGGEKIVEIVTTDGGGISQVVATFNLYREQPIVATGCYINYSECFESTLTWEVADAYAEKPEDNSPRKYLWQAFLILIHDRTSNP
jgi:hypothetical protein